MPFTNVCVCSLLCKRAAYVCNLQRLQYGIFKHTCEDAFARRVGSAPSHQRTGTPNKAHRSVSGNDLGVRRGGYHKLQQRMDPRFCHPDRRKQARCRNQLWLQNEGCKLRAESGGTPHPEMWGSHCITTVGGGPGLGALSARNVGRPTRYKTIPTRLPDPHSTTIAIRVSSPGPCRRRHTSRLQPSPRRSLRTRRGR
jgi:hypothetical protein